MGVWRWEAVRVHLAMNTAELVPSAAVQAEVGEGVGRGVEGHCDTGGFGFQIADNVKLQNFMEVVWMAGQSRSKFAPRSRHPCSSTFILTPDLRR